VVGITQPFLIINPKGRSKTSVVSKKIHELLIKVSVLLVESLQLGHQQDKHLLNHVIVAPQVTLIRSTCLMDLLIKYTQALLATTACPLKFGDKLNFKMLTHRRELQRLPNDPQVFLGLDIGSSNYVTNKTTGKGGNVERKPHIAQASNSRQS
jgi:hypothetical protein